MSEKGDLPHDNISLPPNYAPSETYTESPPPAYHKQIKSTQIYIVRMTCLTILSVVVLCGFFISFSSWMNTRACKCEPHHEHITRPIQAASFVGLPDPMQDLVSLNTIDTEPISNDKIQTKVDKEKQKSLIEGELKEESLEALEEEIIKDEKMIEEFEKEANIIEEKELNNMKKRVKLPIDMLLGNPALAGRDVQCEVEKKIHDMGGFSAQAIIVTCKDEDSNESSDNSEKQILLKPKNIMKPPLSILSNIMKMIASKARTERLNENKPKIIVHPLSGSVPRPLEHNLPIGLFGEPKNIINIRPMPGAPILRNMPQIIESGTIHNPIRRLDSGPIINGDVVARAFNGQPPNMIPGEVMKEILNNIPPPMGKPFPPMNNNLPQFNGPFNPPLIRIDERRPFPPPNFVKIPIGFNPMNGPMPHPFFKPINNLPVNPHIVEDNHHHHENGEIHHHHGGHMPHHHMEGPMPTFNNENIHPRNDRMMEPPSKPEPIAATENGPFPFPLPKNIIPLNHLPSDNNEEENSKPKLIKILPLKFSPLRIHSANRQSRLLTNDAPFPINDNIVPPPFKSIIESIKPILMSPKNFLPLARGNLPLTKESVEDEESKDTLPHPVPEGSGRALPEPINISKIRFLPGKLIQFPPSLQPLGEILNQRIITHMEMKKAPESTDEELPPMPNTEMIPPAPEVPFGPPKGHSLIGQETEEEDHSIEIDESEDLPKLPSFFPLAPEFPETNSKFFPFSDLPELNPDDSVIPEPHMRPEGRSGIIPEINPESEIISDAPIVSESPTEKMEEAPVVEDSLPVHSNNRHVILMN